MKSKYLTLILVSLLVSGLAFAYIVYLPKIEAFALKEVNQAASNSNVVDLKAEALSINPFLLKASINDLQINPKGDLKKTLSSLTLKRVAARISFLGLLRGQVRLAKVEASQARAQLIIDTTAKSSKPIEIPLKQIFRLPIDEIQLEDITLLGRIDPQKTVFKLEDFSLKLENRYNSLWIDLSAPSAFMKP
ncbi:MAG TPA: hypothetical protein DCL41_09785, partial [Bdellovibrionales bacterium]|nr:hypothetical protein [Bdellovibrionales bacterium]